MRISVLTQEILKSLLSYDRETGIFTWISGNRKNVKPGKVCATGSNDDYIIITVLGCRYVAHRLAWLYVYGELPKGFLDHKNGIRSDNRIENIRIATRTQNNVNKKIHKNNKLGIKNVYMLKNGIYRVQVKMNGKSINRNARTEEQAIALANEIRLLVHGEFATDGNRGGLSL